LERLLSVSQQQRLKAVQNQRHVLSTWNNALRPAKRTALGKIAIGVASGQGKVEVVEVGAA
jgi:hypothetical protein